MWHGQGEPIVGGCFYDDMLKCPNCGSVAQIKLVDVTENGSIVLEVYQCGCGTRIQRFLKREMDVYWSPTGTMIARKKYETK